MLLPGRLKTTTLGDLLGVLYRNTSSGTLELVGPGGGVHRIFMARGLVTAVRIDGASASLAEILRSQHGVDEDTLRSSLLRAMASRRLHGEVLASDFHLSPEIIGRALRRQIMLRLTWLEELVDATVCFRVALRVPRGALVDHPLAASEFLCGRKRARDKGGDKGDRGEAGTGRASAYRMLGLPLGANDTDVKRAYRRLVRTYHPDLHPGATPDERCTLSLRFNEVTAAYRALTCNSN
ncbi:MAG: J domain-containing protein [Polyangiaceae bacterium]|nr:J domain-containing protein [Polyangiaceae bacterium]